MLAFGTRGRFSVGVCGAGERSTYRRCQVRGEREVSEGITATLVHQFTHQIANVIDNSNTICSKVGQRTTCVHLAAVNSSGKCSVTLLKKKSGQTFCPNEFCSIFAQHNPLDDGMFHIQLSHRATGWHHCTESPCTLGRWEAK